MRSCYLMKKTLHVISFMQSRKNNIFFTIHFIYIGTSSYFSFSKKKNSIYAYAICMCWLFSYCQTLLADCFSIHSGVDVPICTDFSGIDAWFLMCELGYFISSYRLSPYKFRFFPISNYRIHRSGMIFLLYFCCKPKKTSWKRFYLFYLQFSLFWSLG